MLHAAPPVDTFDPSVLFRVVDVAGVITNGLLGGAVARARRFDLIGFLVLAIISGLGGGIIRDLMLNTGLPVALTDPWYLASAVAAAVFAYVVTLDGLWSHRSLVVADVLALGCWSATGAAKGMAIGLDPLPCLLTGAVTAVGGGMLRDIIVGNTPAIFGGHPLYATLALVGSLEMVVLGGALNQAAGMAASIGTCLILGLLARRMKWMLPGPIDSSRLNRDHRPRKRVPHRNRRRPLPPRFR